MELRHCNATLCLQRILHYTDNSMEDEEILD